MARRRVPEHLRRTNGPEFIATCMESWLKAQRITLYIWPMLIARCEPIYDELPVVEEKDVLSRPSNGFVGIRTVPLTCWRAPVGSVTLKRAQARHKSAKGVASRTGMLQSFASWSKAVSAAKPNQKVTFRTGPRKPNPILPWARDCPGSDYWCSACGNPFWS